MISARGDQSPLAACLSAVEAGSSPSESEIEREIFEGIIMSTVRNMPATGEIVVGLDKSAAGWWPTASARSTGQPLRAVQVFSCSPEGGSRGPRSRRTVRPGSASQLGSA